MPASFPYACGTDAMTLTDYGALRLTTLCRGAGFGQETESVVATFRRLLSPWGGTPVGYSTGWVSEIGDDHTPIEFSIAIVDGQPEVRVLMEAQAGEPTLAAQRRAGLAFNDRLAVEFGADLSRLELVRDLFLPEDMQGVFGIWHAVCFSPGRAPTFKAYLNPQARGVEHSRALTEEALVRLGFGRAFATIARTQARRGTQADEIKYFALDLASTQEARVKIYVNHHRATPDDLEIACSAARNYAPGEPLEFARKMSGGSSNLAARSPFTCSAFVAGDDERPTLTTLYVPVCAYARDNGVIRDRVTDYLLSHGIDPSLYRRILEDFAQRPLDAGVGMQSWVALRREGARPRLAVYLSTESRHVFEPGSVPAATVDPLAFESAAAIVERVRRDDLSEHPFLRRSLREESDAGAIWLLIANAYEGTSKHFTRWLAHVTAAVEDNRVRSLLARQLNQEMGDGDYTQAHSVLMQSFLAGIEPWRPAGFHDGHSRRGGRWASASRDTTSPTMATKRSQRSWLARSARISSSTPSLC